MKDITRMRNLAKRNSLSKNEVEAKSRLIWEKLGALPEFQKAKTIMFYYSVNNEVQTKGLIEKAIKEGKVVALPATEFEKRKMIPAKIESVNDVEKTPQGLFEPKEKKEIKTKELDLIILPGVAFDRQGHRIGMGKGFYDSLLRKTSTKISLIGICFDENFEELIPIESHDVKMDIIVTDRQVVRF